MDKIPLFKVFMSEEAIQAAGDTLRSGYITEGPKVAEFEKSLSRYLQTDYALAVNGCTSAINLALKLAGVGPGDKVLASPFTCAATNLPILNTGAEITWVDISLFTGNIDVEDLRKKISEEYKALVFVHWSGIPAELQEIYELATANNVSVIEDCAHAFGATLGDELIGSLGIPKSFQCFSFQAIKHLTSGDGGLLVCHDKEMYERGKLLRWYGIPRSRPIPWGFDIPDPGYKYHMNDINASIGLANLKSIDWILGKHRQHAWYYDEVLRDIDGLQIMLPSVDKTPSYWIYTILVSEREDFMRAMSDRGVQTDLVHVRNDKYTCFQKFQAPLPILDIWEKCYVNIPCGWWLTEQQLVHIAQSIKKGW